MIVVVLLLFAVSSHGAVIFGDCGSAYELQSVSIEGCRWSLPCYLTLGEQPEVTVVFRADFSSLYLAQDVVINLNYVNLRTEVTPEPCASTGCPVSTSRSTTFVAKMFVPSNMAQDQRGTLRWRVYNENHQQVLCYYVLVQTQSPLQKRLRQMLEANLTVAAESITRDQG